MRKLLACTLLLNSLSVFAAATYDCVGGSFDPVKVEVVSTSKVVINNTDILKANLNDLKDTAKKTIRLVGRVPTLGDGSEGYGVQVSTTRYLLNGSKTAYLNTYNKGPDGFFTDSYTCKKR